VLIRAHFHPENTVLELKVSQKSLAEIGSAGYRLGRSRFAGRETPRHWHWSILTPCPVPPWDWPAHFQRLALHMLKCHELMGFISPSLAQEIIEFVFKEDKPLYRTVLAAVADVHRVRPAFLERKPRTQRHAEMIATLSRPRLEEAAANLLRGWLLKAENAIVTDFLDSLGIPHEKGLVEDFPKEIDDAKLDAAIDLLLSKHPKEKVIVYLNTVKSSGGADWQNLGKKLAEDPRLQLG